MKAIMNLFGKYGLKQLQKTFAIIFFFVGANCFGQELKIANIVTNPANAFKGWNGEWPSGSVGKQWNDVLKKYRTVRLGSSDPFVKSDGLEDRIGQFVFHEVLQPRRPGDQNDNVKAIRRFCGCDKGNRRFPATAKMCRRKTPQRPKADWGFS